MGRSATIVLGILAASALAAVLALVAVRSADRKLSGLRSRGLYPGPGSAGDGDVARLLAAGEKVMAIRCYREIHQVGLAAAKDAVEQLEARGAGPAAPPRDPA
jgi:ribosomal protein L7/L12